MIHTVRVCSMRWAAIVWVSISVTAQAEEPAVDFDRDVRPILSRHCVACHGGVKQTAGLSLVYAESALDYVEPGDPDESILIERVQTNDLDLRMPPPDHGLALNDDEVETLRRWVAAGANWQQPWALRSPRRHEPSPAGAAWARSPIDGFVFDALAARGLTPNPQAQPDRWLRRVSLDLTGLPPTPDQRRLFLADVAQRGEAAYAAAVDRLLASPDYGQRVASVWLDAVRYADSKGLGQDGRREIWKYRDWVINALNNDLPYDQFTIKQIAGDQLESPTIGDRVATATHRLTQTNEEGGTDDEQFRVEAVLDRVSTVWQTWMGVSFGCVQCHDHPYDPIRHDEYYQFVDFFNNTVDCDLSDDEPRIDVPIDPRDESRAGAIDRERAALWLSEWSRADEILGDEATWTSPISFEATTDNDVGVEVESIESEGGGLVAEYRLTGTMQRNTTVTMCLDAPEGIDEMTAIRFTGLPVDPAAAYRDAELGFVISQIDLERIPARGGDAVPVELAAVLSDEPDPLIDPARSLDSDDAMGVGPFPRMHHARDAYFLPAEPLVLNRGDRLRLSLRFGVMDLSRYIMLARRGRIAVTDSAAIHDWWVAPDRVAARRTIAELDRQRAEIDSVKLPVLFDRPRPFDRPTHVFHRGNFLDKAEPVVADVPDCLPSLDVAGATPSRLDLARWMVGDENPLTPRVAVNRFWAMLFGTGLVMTQEDFGAAGESPSHPSLLDDLAVRFRDEMGWSVKTLMRELVLSSTYRQSSRADPHRRSIDPSNRYLSRSPSSRLPAETVRDASLFVAGLLDRTIGGPPVHPPIPEGVWDPFQKSDRWRTPPADDPDRYRRTIYTYTKRTIPYPVMQAFDAPSREFCTLRRSPSNTPLQALTMLNDATFVEAAQAFGARMRHDSGTVDQRIAAGFIRVIGREPSNDEVQTLVDLIDQQGGDDDASWTLAATVLLNLDEFLTQ